jgi:hypothetical protein
MQNTIRKMSGWPSPQVRHIYKNRGLVTNYSTIGGICKICPPVIPPPPPPPPANIRVALQLVVPILFLVTVYGNGSYDSGNGILVPFIAQMPMTISMTVQPGNTVLFYSTNISIFNMVDQPVSLLDVSNCPTLAILRCNQTNPGQSYLTGAFDISANQNLVEVQFLNTLISSLTGVTSCPTLGTIVFTGAAFTQTTADELVNDLLTNGTPNGNLAIVNQSGGTIDINGFLYTTLINTYNWTIV